MGFIDMSELLRRQFLITEKQIHKLNTLSHSESVSATEIVRRAIDAYDTNEDDMNTHELMTLVAGRLKEAIADTRKTRHRLDETLKQFEAKA